MAENANATDQLVTLSGLNKVWSQGVIPLYQKLDARLDNIGTVYHFKKTFSTWAAFKSDNTIYPIKKGDAISVDKGYPAYSKDPDNYPKYPEGATDARTRLFICVEASNTKPDYGDEQSTVWEEYWAPIDLGVQKAATDRYGLVELSASSTGDHSYPVSEHQDGKIYTEVSTAGDSYGVIKIGSVDASLGTAVDLNNGIAYVPLANVKKGNNITLREDTDSPAKIIDANIYKSTPGEGISITDSTASDNVITQTITNAGVKSLSNVVSSGNATELKGKLKVETASLQEGAIKFSSDENNTPSYEIQVKGWTNKQETSTAVTHPNPATGDKAGSSSLPVYVNSSGVATAISTISLSRNGNVASFTDSNSSGSAVTISGKNIDSSVAQSALANTSAALKVTGGIVCTSGIAASKVYHSVWNDISDAIEVQDTLKTSPGYCYFFDGKEYHRTDKYCQKGIIGIHSDTAGSVLGRKGKHKELDISVGGFVLAYVDKEYAPGTPLTSASNGRLTKMSLISRILHPERLVATYWKKETNKEWGDETHKVEVNGRHWVKVR